jgi:CheY-like chemotaxis protein
MMPENDGARAMGRHSLPEGRADIPAIFMTAKAESRISEDLMDRGALRSSPSPSIR